MKSRKELEDEIAQIQRQMDELHRVIAKIYNQLGEVAKEVKRMPKE